MGGQSSKFEKDAFWLAVAVAVALHIIVLAGLILLSHPPFEAKYKPLAVMDFAYYDPDGGEAGGGLGDEPSTSPEPGPGEPVAEPPAETPPEPENNTIPEDILEREAEPEPEVEAPEDEAPEVVTSTSEEAPPLPTPPPPKVEEATKPKPKPKAKRTAKSEASDPKAAQPSGGGGTLKGDEAKPGGGIGKGRGGTGGGTGIGNPNALNAYASKIRSKLNRLKKYPSAAASKKISGVVTVNFTVNRQGAVISSRMVKSSGNAALDQEAMALLKRCSPFPPMPKELPQNTLNLTVPISFKASR